MQQAALNILMIKKSTTYREKLFLRSLCLRHNFFRKVLFSVLHSFAGLETYKLLQRDRSTVLLADLSKVLGNGLLAVLSLDINLICQADFLELLVQSSLYHLLDDILRLARVLGIILCLLNKDCELMISVFLRNVVLGNILGSKCRYLHCDVSYRFLDLVIHDVGIRFHDNGNSAAAMYIRSHDAVLRDNLLESSDRELLGDNADELCQSFINSLLRIRNPFFLLEFVNRLCIGSKNLLRDIVYEFLELLVASRGWSSCS